MALRLTHIKGLDGLRLDVDEDSKDQGKYGRAVDDYLASLFTTMYNQGSGPDIPELDFEVKSWTSNRKSKSYTTWIKITPDEIGNFAWQLSENKFHKLTANRIFVRVEYGVVSSHKIVYYTEYQKQLIVQTFNALSKRLAASKSSSVSSRGFILEHKGNTVEFRINNKQLNMLNLTATSNFNNLFKD